MARLKYRILFSVPIVAFLFLCGMFLLRGGPGSWHSRCLEFWQQQNWASLQGLANNLQLLGTPDAETEYFAAMAARQAQDPAASAKFAGLWRQRRVLNWNWERDLARVSASAGLYEKVGFYRARGVTALLILLVPVNLVAIRRVRWMPACSLLSCVGLLLLLL